MLTKNKKELLQKYFKWMRYTIYYANKYVKPNILYISIRNFSFATTRLGSFLLHFLLSDILKMMGIFFKRNNIIR
jgi:hypothetical protein